MESSNILDFLSVNEGSLYKAVCATIDGIETDVVYANHSDKIVIIATQYKKLGSLLVVSKDHIEGIESVAEVVYTVTPLSGKENFEEQAAARFIAENLNSDKKLCMFLCLKTYEPKTVKALLKVLLDIKN